MSSRAALLPLALFSLVACDWLHSKKPPDDPPPLPSAPLPTTPPAAFSATPVAQFADAGDESRTPYEQARDYQAAGRMWMARLVIERKALGPDGTKEEAELLGRICVEQNDEACVAECSKKLGRKIKLDPAAAKKGGEAVREHKEPDTDLAMARDLVLKLEYDAARRLLEPKVLDGKASKAEIRMLRVTCDKQADRMCVALCDAKLK